MFTLGINLLLIVVQIDPLVIDGVVLTFEELLPMIIELATENVKSASVFKLELNLTCVIFDGADTGVVPPTSVNAPQM
jgi:hypothetical protein